MVAENTHLTKDEQRKLIELLKQHEDLLDGTLGKWKGYPYKIELRDGAEPYHACAYSIPHA